MNSELQNEEIWGRAGGMYVIPPTPCSLILLLYQNKFKFKMKKKKKPNKSSAIPALFWAPAVLGHSAILGDPIHGLQKEGFYWLAH